MWCLGSWTIYIVSVSDEIRPAVASYFWQPEPTVNLTVWWVHNHADPLHLTHWQASWSCQSLTPCSDTESSDFHARKQIRVLLKKKKEMMGSLIPQCPSMFKFQGTVPKFCVLSMGGKKHFKASKTFVWGKDTFFWPNSHNALQKAQWRKPSKMVDDY